MLQLELDLKKGTYKNIYLFYGEETFLVEKYISRIKSDILSNEQLLTNYNVYDGKVVNLNHVIEVAKTAPFFANKRIIMLSNTTLFISSAKDSAKPMINFLSEHNNNYIIIFKESKVDKRSSLYKFIKTKGMCVEFNSLPEIELIKWTKLVFKSYGKDIENNNLVLLIRNTNKSMQVIYNEILKLVAYKTDSKITRTDIENITQSSLEDNAFILVSELHRNSKLALELYARLIFNRHEPLNILYLIARQFRLILHVKNLLAYNYEEKEIAQLLNIPMFSIKNYTKQGGYYNEQLLSRALADCMNTEQQIKTGYMDATLAVELLIQRYCCKY